MKRNLRGALIAGSLLWAIAAPAGPEESRGEVAELVTRGERELAAGAFAEAAETYRRVLRTDPGSLPAQLGLARSLAGQGAGGRALAELLAWSEGRIRSGDYAAAEELLEEALRLDPGSTHALARLGRARALDRRYLAAEAPLRQVFEAGAADLQTMLYLGSTLWENGRPEQAEEVLRRAVETSGGALPALHQLGRLLLWAGSYAEAAPLLEETAAGAAAPVDVFLDLARAREGAGDEAGALAAYRRARELLPEHSEVRYGLGMLLLRAGEREAALVELAAYRRLYEEDQERTRRRGLDRGKIDYGRDLLRRGRVDEAVAHLRSLPESADALAALAAALRQAGDPEAAVAALVRAVALAPEREDLRALLNEVRLAGEGR